MPSAVLVAVLETRRFSLQKLRAMGDIVASASSNGTAGGGVHAEQAGRALDHHGALRRFVVDQVQDAEAGRRAVLAHG